MDYEAKKTKVLIFIVAFEAEQTIRRVLQRIPASLSAYHTEILIIDDGSRDKTYAEARKQQDNGTLPFPLRILYNPVNQGYGGNQKIGFHYAIKNGFDIVALVHGDGQYAPECLPELLKPLAGSQADAVFGSRIMRGFDALKGGMPIYKYIGNRMLTWFQNVILRSSLTEFHSGYRLYAVQALKRIPFDLNTNDFHFDTDIIIQLLRAKLRIKELPIPTHYGSEICRVNGIRYAFDVAKTTMHAAVQDLGIFYERKFDVSMEKRHAFESKLGFISPQAFALDRIPSGSSVLNIGDESGYLDKELKRRGCRLTTIDSNPLPEDESGQCVKHDLDAESFPVDTSAYDYVLMLDVIEHRRSPEAFVHQLRRAHHNVRSATFIISTANVSFFIARFMLLFGSFNYGKRGTLCMTHTRLFTFSSLHTLFEQAGYRVKEMHGIPAPFSLALGNGKLAKMLLAVNAALIKIFPGLFSYQIFMVAEVLPTLELLLSEAFDASQRLDKKAEHT